jgi:hypothetical protein
MSSEAAVRAPPAPLLCLRPFSLITLRHFPFSAAEALTIGYVPAPGAVALLGLAGLTSRRRRA